MATETTATTPAKDKNVKIVVTKDMLTELAVTRNGVSHQFKIDKLKKGKNSKGPDQYALVPVEPKSDEDKKNFLTWVGQPLVDIAVGKVRAMSSIWTRLAAKEADPSIEGKDFAGLYGTYASQFSSRGETFKSLFADKARVEAELQAVAVDTTLDVPTRNQKFTELAMKLAELKEAIDFKKASGTDDDEDDSSSEENN